MDPWSTNIFVEKANNGPINFTFKRIHMYQYPLVINIWDEGQLGAAEVVSVTVD